MKIQLEYIEDVRKFVNETKDIEELRKLSNLLIDRAEKILIKDISEEAKWEESQRRQNLFDEEAQKRAEEYKKKFGKTL